MATEWRARHPLLAALLATVKTMAVKEGEPPYLSDDVYRTLERAVMEDLPDIGDALEAAMAKGGRVGTGRPEYGIVRRTIAAFEAALQYMAEKNVWKPKKPQTLYRPGRFLESMQTGPLSALKWHLAELTEEQLPAGLVVLRSVLIFILLRVGWESFKEVDTYTRERFIGPHARFHKDKGPQGLLLVDDAALEPASAIVPSGRTVADLHPAVLQLQADLARISGTDNPSPALDRFIREQLATRATLATLITHLVARQLGHDPTHPRESLSRADSLARAMDKRALYNGAPMVMNFADAVVADLVDVLADYSARYPVTSGQFDARLAPALAYVVAQYRNATGGGRVFDMKGCALGWRHFAAKPAAEAPAGTPTLPAPPVDTAPDETQPSPPPRSPPAGGVVTEEEEERRRPAVDDKRVQLSPLDPLAIQQAVTRLDRAELGSAEVALAFADTVRLLSDLVERAYMAVEEAARIVAAPPVDPEADDLFDTDTTIALLDAQQHLAVSDLGLRDIRRDIADGRGAGWTKHFTAASLPAFAATLAPPDFPAAQH